jgi:hypothetical protein
LRKLLALGMLPLLLPLAASARRPSHKRAPPPAAAVDPARFFASRPGLVRIYEGRSEGRAANPEDDNAEPPAGASCEVLEARPREASAPGSVTESCTMIVGRKARPSAELTYALRPDGIWEVQVKPEGGKSQEMSRLVLPSPLRVGSTWKEPSGKIELDRTVKSTGGSCHAAGRTFADCLVLGVVQKQGSKIVRRYTETYAAGVGMVEDAQWDLVDVKGL